MKAGTPNTYHLFNRCKDLEQLDIMFNMMRPCIQNTKLSVHKVMDAMISFNATPMSHIGTKFMTHKKNTRWQTWGYHVMTAWYCTPALNYYWCNKILTESGSVRVMNTFKFKHENLFVLMESNVDGIIKALQDLRWEVTATPGTTSWIHHNRRPPYIHLGVQPPQ